MNIGNFYRVAHKLDNLGIPLLPKIIYYIQFILFNSSVPYKCKSGEGTVFGYGGIAVVVHERAVIGKRCLIGQNVTIGGKSKKYEVPIIGNHVYIGAGAKILGDIIIGDDVIIGANSVVICDIPSNCIAAGVPAKIIKSNIVIDDIEEF